MADSFKAVVINNQNENFTREVKELSLDHFKDGDVLVKIDYSDLNWKDAMILKDGGKLVKEYPRIPGIDFSGTVAQGDGEEFKEGDRVILTGCRAGELFDGGYSQYAKVKKDHITKTGENEYKISSYVDSQNGFGAMIRSEWSCTIKFVENDKVQCKDLIIY